jgi:hypothetical protein
MDLNSWDVERRADGAVLVRVHSAERDGARLPDAVFTFRHGDPQFEYWESQWRIRQGCAGSDLLERPSPVSSRRSPRPLCTAGDVG